MSMAGEEKRMTTAGRKSTMGAYTQPRRRDPMRTLTALAAVMLLVVTGCATTQQVAVKDQPAICGFLGDACDQLRPGDTAKGEAGLRYVNPKAQFTQYNKVIVDVVGFFGSDAAKVPPKDQQALTDYFYKSLTEQFAKKFQVVDQAGPGALRVQAAILDAEAATPGARSISMAIPQARALAAGTSLVTGSYPFAGGTQAAVKFVDSVTGKVVGAVVDRQAGGGSVEAAAQWQWGDAENAIKSWSERLANGLYAYTSGARKP